MAEGARYASEELGRRVHLWEIQRILEGQKALPGLEVLRADEPLPRRARKPKQARKLSTKSRRKLAAAGKRGGSVKKHPKDITKALLGLSKVGEKNPAAKLTEEQVLDIIFALEEGEKPLALALRYGVSVMQISRIKTGKRWKYLKESVEWEE
jgi:hypothetical protein